MLNSMTGFARSETVVDQGVLTWELRSLNHRYLDLSVRMPERLRCFEPVVRDRVSQKVKRGKVELTLKWDDAAIRGKQLVMNESLLSELSALYPRLQQEFPSVSLDAMALLNWPGLLVQGSFEPAVMETVVLSGLDESLGKLTATRLREGSGIVDFLAAQIDSMRSILTGIEGRLPAVLAESGEKIVQRFAELTLEVPEDRLAHEILWYTQKLDIAEECQRLASHMQAVTELLAQGGVIGRKLDFLMQELNREANTIASKSADAQMTQAAVSLKVHIEKMREQVQNIE